MPGLSRPRMADRRVANRNREAVGQFLAAKRRERDLTQEEFQKLIGHDAWFSAWSAIETGNRNLPPALWEPVAKALRIQNAEFAKFMLRYTNPWDLWNDLRIYTRSP
jgi:transcriptional regulator with XRE-family HTH domain